MSKKKKQPKAEDEEECEPTPAEVWQAKIDKNGDTFTSVRKLVYTFYEQYTQKEIKERSDLQLQIELYRKEGTRLAQESAQLMVEMWQLRRQGQLPY